MSVYIVESPFQLISAIEASFYFKDKQPFFIIKYNGKNKNKNQILIIKEYFNITNALEINPVFSNFDSNIQLLNLLRKMGKNNIYFDRVFIGEYRSFHMRKFFDYFNKSESFCLDDGNIVYKISQYVEKGLDQYYFYDNGIKGRFKKIVYELQSMFFGFNKFSVNRDIKIFTCFDIPVTNNIIKHNFSNIKNHFKKPSYKKEIYFYGSNLALVGIQAEKEFELLSKALNYFTNVGLEVTYFPHRSENENKLNFIKEVLQVKVVTNSFPAEIQLLMDGYVPLSIASFGSSVLMTLPTLFPEIKNSYAFFPDIALVNEIYRLEWEEIRLKYKEKIHVIDL